MNYGNTVTDPEKVNIFLTQISQVISYSSVRPLSFPGLEQAMMEPEWILFPTMNWDSICHIGKGNCL